MCLEVFCCWYLRHERVVNHNETTIIRPRKNK
jgi:hypothetical protein